MPDFIGNYKKVIITSIKEEVNEVKTFTIIAEDGNLIPYQAGQFLTFVFDHRHKEERRSFSISSAPETETSISFTVKRVDNGAYSRLLIDRAKPGDVLYTTGAAGLFVLPENIEGYKQVFLFAAGIGITPIYSLAKSMLHKYPQLQVTLIYSNPHAGATVFLKELQELQKQYSGRLTIEFLYSSSFDLSRARLNKSLLPQLVNEYAKCGLTEMLFYVCGPFSYMRMVIFALEEMGIKDDQIKKENFNTNDKPVIHRTPPDTETHIATVTFDGATHSFPVTYPDSILQAAKKQGISLPYSCETGQGLDVLQRSADG
jgi:ring-1,2-phenylacetyl-CoA epoxidase subunit PaaE